MKYHKGTNVKVAGENREIYFDTWEHMILPSERIYFDMSKTFEPKFGAYISTFYLSMTMVAKNRRFFLTSVKEKRSLVKSFFLASNFVFLHTIQKIMFFHVMIL